MNASDFKATMYDVLHCVTDIDNTTARLHGGQKFFGEVVSLGMPKFHPPELGLLRTVSWFYVLYFEIGRVNVEFMTEKIPVYDLDPAGELCEHPREVDRLRTYFQHHLDPGKSRHRKIQYACESWFRTQCEAPNPDTDEQWTCCLRGLLEQAHGFVSALRFCIRRIHEDEAREQIVTDWNLRIRRYHPRHEFDGLLSQVASDMGRDALDVVGFRNRFYDKWVKELGMLQGDYEFEVEARKLMEHALMSETTRKLPLTGRDIMEEFAIPPGPEVGEFLNLARSMYDTSPCQKADLLDRLRQQIGSRKDS